jgi:hypothetical protein
MRLHLPSSLTQVRFRSNHNVQWFLDTPCIDSSLRHLLRDYFAHQEEVNTRNSSELSQRLNEMTHTLGKLESTLERVESTLQSSFTLQEQHFSRQMELFDLLHASVTQQEKAQAVIVQILEK